MSINLFSDIDFRVMSYNALNFDGTSRLSDFQTVLNNSTPDIVICQEIASESASDAMLSVLNSAIGGFARATFVSDGDLNNIGSLLCNSDTLTANGGHLFLQAGNGVTVNTTTMTASNIFKIDADREVDGTGTIVWNTGTATGDTIQLYSRGSFTARQMTATSTGISIYVDDPGYCGNL